MTVRTATVQLQTASGSPYRAADGILRAGILPVAHFRASDAQRVPGDILGWHDVLCCDSPSETGGTGTVELHVPELPDGYSARSWLYRRMLDSGQLICGICRLQRPGSFTLSAHCLFRFGNVLRLLICESGEIQPGMFDPAKPDFYETWKHFISGGRIYRCPFQIIQHDH